MNAPQRIRLARRHAALSQAALAAAVGVQRSAVSHWEATDGKSPSTANLRRVAMVTGVQFEWLATGRGRMGLATGDGADATTDTDPAAVDDPLELRLLAAFRALSIRGQVPLVELMEQMAQLRTGYIRGRPPAP